MHKIGSNSSYHLEEDDDYKFPLQYILWSAFYFALTYILISYSGYLVQSINASVLDYDVKFSYDGVAISGGTSPWTLKRISFVFLASPFLGMLFSMIGFAFCNKLSRNKSHLRIFFFWLSINGFAFFYSYFFTGILAFGNYYTKYFTGFVAFLAWLYLSKGVITFILLTLTALFAIYPVIFGWLTLSVSYSSLLQDRKGGRKIIFRNVIILPYLLGLILIIAATYPLDNVYHLVRWLVYPIIFAVIYLWFTKKKIAAAIVVKGGLANRSQRLLLLLSIMLILAGRFLLPIIIEL